MAKTELSKLTDAELRNLQSDNPPVNNDASNPANEWPNAITAEGKRRGLW